jgi:glutathione S-transferase
LLRLLDASTPNLTAYLARCEERPAYKRAAA